MKIFTGNEAHYLEIIAVNAGNPGMKDFLNRVIMPMLGNEARLVGLLLLKRQEEFDQASRFFSPVTIAEVRAFGSWISEKAQSALADLEERVANSKRRFVAA